MQKIQILIAAHKISELPKNSLFLPVEVGAANRKAHLPGYQRDDAGDNISAQNPNYCELTAIYWGWKNLNCDYCGIMHYRRFFSFSDTRYPVSRDGRKMIRWPAATKERYEEFGLLDESKMRQIIESNDLIVAESQNVKEIYTPLNHRRRTVEKHYIDHEDCIIKMADLNLALDIAKQKYPEAAPYIDKYMHQKMYLGYNMWIAKKLIYDEICDFMFSVLKDVEDKIDIRYYNTQMARVYGYLAEVLSSAYIYYLRQTRDYKVNERQMIYIEDTVPVQPIAPVEKNACPIIFDLTVPAKTQYLPMLFLPCLENFLKNAKKKYDIIIFYNADPTPITEKALAEIANLSNKYKNCTIRTYQLALELARCNIKFAPGKSLLNYLTDLPIDYDKILYLKWSTIIKGEPAELFKIDFNTPIAAAADVMTEGKINQYKSVKLKYINEHNISRDDIFDLGVMVLKPKKLVELSGKGKIEDLFRTAYAGAWTKIPACWNYQIPTYPNDEYTVTLAPAADFVDRESNAAKIINFEFKNVCTLNNRAFYTEYFNLMKDSVMFGSYLSLVLEPKTSNFENNMVLTGTFPVGSPKRELLSKMFPHGSRRRNLIDKILKVFLREK